MNYVPFFFSLISKVKALFFFFKHVSTIQYKKEKHGANILPVASETRGPIGPTHFIGSSQSGQSGRVL